MQLRETLPPPAATPARVAELRTTLSQLLADPARPAIVERAAQLADVIARDTGASGHPAAERAALQLASLLRAWPDGGGLEEAAALLRQVDLHRREVDG